MQKSSQTFLNTVLPFSSHEGSQGTEHPTAAGCGRQSRSALLLGRLVGSAAVMTTLRLALRLNPNHVPLRLLLLLLLSGTRSTKLLLLVQVLLACTSTHGAHGRETQLLLAVTLVKTVSLPSSR